MYIVFCVFDEGGLKEEVIIIKEVGIFFKIIEFSVVILFVESKILFWRIEKIDFRSLYFFFLNFELYSYWFGRNI